MVDDPKEVVADALRAYAAAHVTFHAEDMAGLALVALDDAGWRLMREDDLRWMVDAAIDEYVDPDYVPPGVRALMDEMEDE